MDKSKMYWTKIRNSGYQEPVYQNYAKEIMDLNMRMVKGTSFIGSIMMLILTVTSLFISSVNKVLPLYCFTMFLFIAIYIIVKFIKNENETLILLCNYLFLTAAFIFAIGLDMIQKNTTATTVCVLLVALPLLIVDKPLKENGYFLGITFLFVLEVIFVKQNAKASIDILNAFSFYFIGQFLGYRHNQMMLRNIKGHDLLVYERDRDSLTSLYNKGAIEFRAGEYLTAADAVATIIVIDMDDFKFVNDTFGHHVGDELLIAIARVLQSLGRENDIISRFGGDEFIVFMPGIDDKEIITKRAEQILAGVAQVRLDNNPEYRAHICMGIATCPACGNEYEDLFKKADSALYKVKKNGKNGYKIYDPDSKKNILIVDDIEVNRVVLRTILGNEFHILEADNGNAALSILDKEEDIDLVITDIQMPHMDGVELIRHIRENHRFDDISIIANTQYGDLQQEEEIYRLGVTDFVYKPASAAVIQLRVRNIMKADHTI